MTYQTLTASFLGSHLSTQEDETPFIKRLTRQYRQLATGQGASDIDQWIDQLSAQQLHQLYRYEQGNAQPDASVLKLVCHQFLSLTIGERVTSEQLDDYYAAAQQRVAERLEEKL